MILETGPGCRATTMSQGSLETVCGQMGEVPRAKPGAVSSQLLVSSVRQQKQ